MTKALQKQAASCTWNKVPRMPYIHSSASTCTCFELALPFWDKAYKIHWKVAVSMYKSYWCSRVSPFWKPLSHSTSSLATSTPPSRWPRRARCRCCRRRCRRKKAPKKHRSFHDTTTGPGFRFGLKPPMASACLKWRCIWNGGFDVSWRLDLFALMTLCLIGFDIGIWRLSMRVEFSHVFVARLFSTLFFTAPCTRRPQFPSKALPPFVGFCPLLSAHHPFCLPEEKAKNGAFA